MHTPESLSALTAREFLNLMRGYEPAEIDSLMSWLWGKPEVLAAGLNYLDRCREFAAITDSERTCDEVNPDGHWPCHRSGDHDEHRDHNGGTWRTLHPHCVHCDPDSCNPMTPGHVVACQTPGCPSVQQMAVAS